MIKILLVLAICCAATIVLEGIPILFLKSKKAWWKASILCNVVTNPLLNVIVLFLPVVLDDYLLIAWLVMALEVVVVFFETWFYQLMLEKSCKKCFLFSLIANGFSFVVGSVLNILMLIPW